MKISLVSLFTVFLILLGKGQNLIPEKNILNDPTKSKNYLDSIMNLMQGSWISLDPILNISDKPLYTLTHDTLMERVDRRGFLSALYFKITLTFCDSVICMHEHLIYSLDTDKVKKYYRAPDLDASAWEAHDWQLHTVNATAINMSERGYSYLIKSKKN